MFKLQMININNNKICKWSNYKTVIQWKITNNKNHIKYLQLLNKQLIYCNFNLKVI